MSNSSGKSYTGVHQPSTINHQPFSISIYADKTQKSELRNGPLFQKHRLLFAADLGEMMNRKADAYMDLLFETDTLEELGLMEMDKKPAFDILETDTLEELGMEGKKTDQRYFGKWDQIRAERAEALSRLLPSPVFINSVIQTLSAVNPGLIRINGWPGFLGSSLLEASANDDHSREEAKKIFGEQMIFVKDIPGFVTPRIISMIINEAYYTLGAGISSREEIDTAMKLGTGYPMGPFEWAGKIGHFRVTALLTAMCGEDPLYSVAEGLVDS